MKIKRFLLNDDTQKNSIQYLDLITFEKEVELEEVEKVINRCKEEKAGEYTNEDIYMALDKLGVPFTVDFIGDLYLIEY